MSKWLQHIKNQQQNKSLSRIQNAIKKVPFKIEKLRLVIWSQIVLARILDVFGCGRAGRQLQHILF